MSVSTHVPRASLSIVAAVLGCVAAQSATPSGGRRLPADVAAFVARASRCATEQSATAAETWVARERCMMLPEEKARLLRRHARDRALVALLRRIDTSLF